MLYNNNNSSSQIYSLITLGFVFLYDFIYKHIIGWLY